MVGRTLEMSGLALGRVAEAANGREGLEVLDHEWIDVLFVDINMPVMGGIEMIDAIRARPELANLPIVVISTESSHTRIEEVRRKGVRFVHKPFTPECVREVIQDLTGVTQHATE